MVMARFLVDMNISPKTVRRLQQQGWEVIRVSELLPVSASDQEILELARHEKRVLVTQDLDFSALLALGGYHEPSLITFRLSVSDPEAITKKLLEIVPQVEQVLSDGCAISVDDSSFRVRRLPIRF